MSSDKQALMPDLCSRRHPLHYGTALNLLLIAGVDLNQVFILSAGENENYKGEILEQEPKPGTPLLPDARITLRVGHAAAFDNLPYQFFYGLESKRDIGSEWEERARCLTVMFDSPDIRHNARALRQMLKFSFAVPDLDQMHRYLQLFGFDRKNATTLEEAITWAVILPTYNEWAGNPDRVVEVLHNIFGYTFRIVENIRSEFEIPQDIRYQLGSKTGRLGKETILGRNFSEFDSAYQVIVGGIPRNEITGFLSGGKRRKKVEKVIGLCMPSNLDYQIIFETDARTLKLGEKSHLGYSTRV